MHTKLKRVALTLAALTAASAGLVLSSTTASALLPPNTPPVAPAILSPSSGNINTTYTLTPTPPTASFCPGDANAGYSVRTFMTPTSNDPSQITFSGAGPVGPGFTQPLFTSAGSPVVAVNPAPGTATDPRGRILNLGNLSFSALGTVPDGAYHIGIACVRANESETYYSTQITFTSDNWAFGAVPAAPVIGAISTDPVSLTATVPFTHAASTPTTTGYTATVTPVNPAGAALPDIAVPAGATSFPVSGLTLGTEYSASLIATNATGDSPAAVANFTVALNESLRVTAPDAFEGNAVTITWDAPTSGPTPVSYDLAITPGGPTFTDVAGLSQVVPAGLAIGVYTATVTANYAPGAGATASGSDTFKVNPNALLYQEISVTRPPGALILTQRCGVYGPLDEFVAVDAFPGFPRTLAAEGASADQVGTAPVVIDPDTGAPVVTDFPILGGTQDPEFGNYPEPSPATYPTECGLDMGTARFVTSGSLAGQFYTADGRLNQVTVLDTRDTDTGWIARGFVEDFTSGGDTFDGSYLGWTPQVTDTSDPVGGSTYDQVVTPGDQVLPGTAPGLTTNSVLGESQALEGLGIATMDARMNLLIPASADAGDYAATLSLSVIPRPIP